MDMYEAVEDEISYLEASGRHLRAAANKGLYFANEQARDFERADALRRVADNLAAASKLDGYANHLRMFGRDYSVTDYADDEEPEA